MRRSLEERCSDLRAKLARERAMAKLRTHRVQTLLRGIWRTRGCFVCGQFGWCRHREPAVDLAVYEADSAKGAYGEVAVSAN